jgi:hypothetical protein
VQRDDLDLCPELNDEHLCDLAVPLPALRSPAAHTQQRYVWVDSQRSLSTHVERGWGEGWMRRDAQPFVLHVALCSHEVHGEAKRYSHLQSDHVAFEGRWIAGSRGDAVTRIHAEEGLES